MKLILIVGIFVMIQGVLTRTCGENKEKFIKSPAPSTTLKSSEKNSADTVEQLFQAFQNRYARYYKTLEEYQLRFNIFKENLKKIEELIRNEKGTAVYEINQFSDLKTEEFLMNTGLLAGEAFNFTLTELSAADIPNEDLPEHFDWREKGVVTRVKDQGQCGSCWAFSAVGNIESLNAIKTGKLQELSEQQLLDCDAKDYACSGGWPIQACLAIKEIGGLHLESDYQYHAQKQECHFDKNLSLVKIENAVALPKDETQMQQWLVANGPISISINVEPWMSYKEGVIRMDDKTCSQSSLNHAMLIVGYGVSNDSLPYWIIKNSWGPDWGEKGYARLYRGENVCGVRQDAISAVLQ